MYCRKCLYCLEGITPGAGPFPRGRCPECGRAFDPEWPDTFLKTPRRRRAGLGWLGWVLAMCAAYPIAWISTLYANYLYARVQLGHWPIPWVNDPKDCGLGILHGLFGIGCLGALPVAVAALLAVILAPLLRPRRWWWLAPLVLLAWAGAILLLRLDPFDVVTWYFD